MQVLNYLSETGTFAAVPQPAAARPNPHVVSMIDFLFFFNFPYEKY